MIAREMRVMESYLHNHHSALSSDYSCSTAAKGKDILLQVAARAIKGLCKQEVRLVTSMLWQLSKFQLLMKP